MEELRKDLLIADPRPYVLWRRVSTEKQGESGLGLDAQLTMARMFTRRDPEEVFTDVYSGTKLRECHNLWKAISYCKKNNCLLVVAKTDRFRNVKEALEVLDEVGEYNISFCDLPHVYRMILTIMFSVWERQAIIGRLNTKIALGEIKKKCEKNGGWVSKSSGQWRTKLGCPPKTEEIKKNWAEAMAEHNRKVKSDWYCNSTGIKWIKVQLEKGVSRKDIIKEFNIYHDMKIDGFASREGKPLTEALLSAWIKYIRENETKQTSD